MSGLIPASKTFGLKRTAMLWFLIGFTLWRNSGLRDSLTLPSTITAGEFAASVSAPICAAWGSAYLAMVYFHKKIHAFFVSTKALPEAFISNLMQTYNIFQVIFNFLWCVLVLYVLRWKRAAVAPLGVGKVQPMVGALEQDG